MWSYSCGYNVSAILDEAGFARLMSTQNLIINVSINKKIAHAPETRHVLRTVSQCTHGCG